MNRKYILYTEFVFLFINGDELCGLLEDVSSRENISMWKEMENRIDIYCLLVPY